MLTHSELLLQIWQKQSVTSAHMICRFAVPERAELGGAYELCLPPTLTYRQRQPDLCQVIKPDRACTYDQERPNPHARIILLSHTLPGF